MFERPSPETDQAQKRCGRNRLPLVLYPLLTSPATSLPHHRPRTSVTRPPYCWHHPSFEPKFPAKNSFCQLKRYRIIFWYISLQIALQTQNWPSLQFVLNCLRTRKGSIDELAASTKLPLYSFFLFRHRLKSNRGTSKLVEERNRDIQGYLITLASGPLETWTTKGRRWEDTLTVLFCQTAMRWARFSIREHQNKSKGIRWALKCIGSALKAKHINIKYIRA